MHRGTIDVEIFGKMAADGVAPTDRSTDAEFLRRAMLDLTGQIPSTPALTAFALDQRPDKRALAVENLLRSDAFNDRWAMWLGDLLENVKTTAANGIEQPLGRDALSSYLRTSLAQAKPYDQLVREILAGNGDSFADGPPNFWVRNLATMGVVQDTWDSQAAAAGEKFLGMQVNCTGCHNGAGHTDSVNVYLSTKTRMDFWKNAAFFAQTTVATAMDPASAQRKYLLSDNTTGSYLLNTTSGNRPARAPAPGQSNKVDPAFYLTGEKPRAGKPLRAEFARMLTAHPQFARATVNYLWKEMFGVGIVEPADGFDLYRLDPALLPPGQTLQASHPALLAAARDAIRLGRVRPPRPAALDGELRGLSALRALHARHLERDVHAVLRAAHHAPDDVRAAPRCGLFGERRLAHRDESRRPDRSGLGNAARPSHAASGSARGGRPLQRVSEHVHARQP